jgi:hypothetical protein
MADWRVYQGVGYLADIVAHVVLILEAVKAASLPNASGQDNLQAAITLLYMGVAEGRALMPHMTAYAARVFEGSDADSDEAPAQQGAATYSEHSHNI